MPFFFIAAALVARMAATAPPDIRLEWVGGAAAVDAEAGATVELRYLVRNTGGSEAFAVVLRSFSSLGPLGDPVRIQPGPAAGASVGRKLSFAAAGGIREVCVEASLQNRNRDDPLDPTPSDNRICRVVRVKPRQTASLPEVLP